MVLNEIFGFIGKIIAFGGGSVAIAYSVFSLLGKKWLDNQFSKQLESFKHAQNLQMEQYRFEMNSLFNRIIKVHEKEFEVLPAMWFKLQEALGNVMDFTNPFQQYPDLNHMSENEVEETLRKTKLSLSQKQKIQKATDKNQTFIKNIFWSRLNETRKYVYDFHNYLLINKILLV